METSYEQNKFPCSYCNDSPVNNPLECENLESCNKLPHNHNQATELLVDKMPDIEVFNQVASAFSLISDPIRVKILWLLCHTEDCVTNIASAVDMSAPAVSHHLRVLKQTGLLQFRRDGKETYYTLADTDEAKTIHHIVDVIFNINCNCY